MVKRHLLAAFLVSLICAAPVAADTISFDPDGPGGNAAPINIGALDWAPGNAIGLGVTANSPAGTTFQLFYQANLGTATDPTGNFPVYTNDTVGSGNDAFTLVLGFQETIATTNFNPATNQGSFTFDFTPGGQNFFAIFANDTFGDNLSGACFVCGDLVMLGTILGDDFFSDFVASPTGPTFPNLDGFNTDNYPGVDTIRGTGSVTLKARVDAYDTNYFNGLNGAVIEFALANSNTNLPYAQTNPSGCFFATSGPPTCTGGFVGVGSVGAVNGLSGENIMFQADGNNSFTVVPEPASLTLLGLGLMGSAAAARRRQRRAKK